MYLRQLGGAKSNSFKDTKILLFLSYDITISIFLLLAYCFITIKLYQIDGQHIDGGGGHHSYGLGRSCGNCHRYVSAHVIYELTYTECDDTDGEISQEKS